MYLRSIDIHGDRFPANDVFPFNVPALAGTPRIDIQTPVTFLVGDNGTGKSALLDALARKSGFLPWGGSKVHRSHDNPYETALANYISVTSSPRHPYGFHFRAEVFLNYAASLDDVFTDDPDRVKYYGGGSLNVLSHGESFLTFFKSYNCDLDGLYLVDEPEAALSPWNQLDFVRWLAGSAKNGKKQFIIASHSPIILSCPGASLLSFDTPPVSSIQYQQTNHYGFYKDFLEDPNKFF